MKIKVGHPNLKIVLMILFLSRNIAQAQQQPSAKTKAQQDSINWSNFQKMIEEHVHKDWAWIKRYESDNEKLPAPKSGEKRVVFMGNSITENWINTDPEYFKQHGYINRGIGGQTTPQMLVRFREDVINLKPDVVVILAGINDIAQNTGPIKLEDTFGNIVSMAELAKANHIKVIFSSVLPAYTISWHPGIDPKPQIKQLNEMLQNYAAKNSFAYIDYYSKMVADDGGIQKNLALEGLHPNLNGYKVMEPLAEGVISKVLKQSFKNSR